MVEMEVKGSGQRLACWLKPPVGEWMLSSTFFCSNLLGTKPSSHLDLGMVVEFAFVSLVPQWHGCSI
ncbi:hypothetical protein Pyn_18541 [Prunus yedoensis var. nudiflora]|uniref:Uncharacterized protein n=1 Tax=Prunus yedoensis var. nudiflora TaxID=2094558 RepID=A0A314U8E5_PRUYE|nr:hypothetical protein Pyn_18541 [Prunus yedoensis var. nudiflora]